jgi:hypothetical protein
MFGGPWKGHVSGATIGGAATGNWALDGLITRDVSTFTPYAIATMGPLASGSIHTLAGQVHPGLQLIHTNSANDTLTEIVLDYPGV